MAQSAGRYEQRQATPTPRYLDTMSIDATKSGERLTFTAFLAIAVHAIVILGVAFTVESAPKVAPTLNITLATHQTEQAPEEADYLAQHNQQASGTREETLELTSTEVAEVVAPTVNQVAPVPQQKSVAPSARDQTYLTTESSDFRLNRRSETQTQDEAEQVNADDEESPYLNPEIASLQAKLDRLQQEFARRPRIRRMTSVATRSSADAEYLNQWTQKVETLGNQHFPTAALANKIFGDLRLSVIVNSDGSVDKVEILKPSGFPVLDQAAVQIVRLASPFAPFPAEIRQTADQLDIIRTWRFEITGLKTAMELD